MLKRRNWQRTATLEISSGANLGYQRLLICGAKVSNEHLFRKVAADRYGRRVVVHRDLIDSLEMAKVLIRHRELPALNRTLALEIFQSPVWLKYAQSIQLDIPIGLSHSAHLLSWLYHNA